ncbi:uncharacterized protein LOC125234262 [Leguminivora glycinivorella]|uniref:uncharacterized protein LOC125234262 n=1 Tax=Leguminivora glycinivorella TaxID=1035111 RepID=UPI00200F4116|nr:uncharacterized protein LOC125234262 [Leguminivora glycinivorella]
MTTTINNILFWCIVVNGISIPSIDSLRVLKQPGLELESGRNTSSPRRLSSLELRGWSHADLPVRRPHSRLERHRKRPRFSGVLFVGVHLRNLGGLPRRGTGSRRGPRAGRRSDARRKDDSDFEAFMKKMFSDMPQSMGKKGYIDEVKDGPNAGYRPYWYGYNFATDRPESKQKINQESSHEDFDYGMGMGNGTGTWGGGAKTLGRIDDQLGAGVLVNEDVRARPKKAKCAPNMGPKCDLGVFAGDLPNGVVESWIQLTKSCNVCSASAREMGLVCTVDNSGEVFQEMHACVMEKNNCVKGIAAIQPNRESYNYYNHEFGEFPFAVTSGWTRVAIHGEEDAHIRLYDSWPFHTSKHNYWFKINTWLRFWWELLWRPPVETHLHYNGESVAAAVNRYGLEYWGGWWKEYTIVWDVKTGWILMSQARRPDALSGDERVVFIEYTAPKPWSPIYIDVSNLYKRWLNIVIYDLPFELSVMNLGSCQSGRVWNDFPTDTEEVLNRTMTMESRHLKRKERFKINNEEWSAEDGPYVEYPHNLYIDN